MSDMDVHMHARQPMEFCAHPITVEATTGSRLHVRLPGVCSIFLTQEAGLDLAEKLTDCVGEIQREVAQC